MGKMFSFLLFVSLLASINMYAQKREKYKEEDGFVWYKIVYEDGVCEAQLSDRTVFVPRYMNCNRIDFDSYWGYFKVVTNEGFEGIYSKDGRCIIEPIKYTSIKPREVSGEPNGTYPMIDFFVVMVHDRVSVCDKNAKQILPLLAECNYVDEHFLVTTIDCLKGVYSKDGTRVITPGYFQSVRATVENDNLAWYTVTYTDGVCEARLNDSDVVISRGENSRYILYNSRTGLFKSYTKKDFCGIYSKDGQCLIAPDKYTSIEPQSCEGKTADGYRNIDYYVVRVNGKVGICDNNMKQIFPFTDKYSSVLVQSTESVGDVVQVQKDGKWGLCDLEGNVIFPAIYEYDIYYDDNEGSYVYSNANGKIIHVKPGFTPQQAIAIKGAKYQLVDALGIPVNPILYDKLELIGDSMYYAGISEYGTYMSLSGTEKVPIGKQIIDKAFEMSASEAQQKQALYQYLVNLDADNFYKCNEEAYNQIGTYLKDKGDIETALGFFHKTLDINPNNIVAQKNITFINAIKRQEEARVVAEQWSQSIQQLNDFNNSLINDKKQGVTQNVQRNNTHYSNNKTYTPNSNNQQTTKKCYRCGGKGELIKNVYVATFGLDGPKLCTRCNQSFMKSSGHTHVKCNTCNGTGVITQ